MPDRQPKKLIMPRKTTARPSTDQKLRRLREIWQEKRKTHLITYSLNQNTLTLAENTSTLAEFNQNNQLLEHCCCCGKYSLYHSSEIKCQSCDLRYPAVSLLEFLDLLQSNLYQHQSICNGQVLFSFHKETGLFMACTDCDEIAFI